MLIIARFRPCFTPVYKQNDVKNDVKKTLETPVFSSKIALPFGRARAYWAFVIWSILGTKRRSRP